MRWRYYEPRLQAAGCPAHDRLTSAWQTSSATGYGEPGRQPPGCACPRA